MRRNLLHVALALLTFTVGLFISATKQNLAEALLAGFIIFVLLKTLTTLDITSHHLKVTVLTLLIWIPFAALVIRVALPSAGSCVLYSSEEAKPSDQAQEKLALRESESETISSQCGCSQSYTEDEAEYNGAEPKAAINGGVLNSKAISLPKPAYPPIAKAARVSDTVVVQVLIDKRGCIETIRALSGHPLLRAASVRAARQSCFYPTLLSGQPMKVKGVITYNFMFE